MISWKQNPVTSPQKHMTEENEQWLKSVIVYGAQSLNLAGTDLPPRYVLV